MVDEIGSSEEVRACRSIAQRGVVIVAAAHGASLKGLITNDELSALVGGVHDVVISGQVGYQSYPCCMTLVIADML